MLVGTLGSAQRAQAFDPTRAPEIQERLLDGTASFELTPTGDAQSSGKLKNYTSSKNDGCGFKDASNIKVNQNCLNITDTDLQGRGQAQNETSIAIDPMQKGRMVASFNDYRRGDGNCYAAYSQRRRQRLERHDAADVVHPRHRVRRRAPVLAGRRRHVGRLGHEGQRVPVVPDVQPWARRRRRTPTSPARSSSSARPATAARRGTSRRGRSSRAPTRPAQDAALLDKQLMTVDDHVGSPFRDRVYVTWTTFAADGTAYIYEAHSNDYGETFSRPVLVSSGQRAVRNTFGMPTPQGSCNENQFSQPFTGADGTLYVAWANFNNVVTGQRQPQPGAAGPVDRRRADASARRSRSATTTTCPTATPTRAPAPTRAAPACRRRGRRTTRSSGRRTTRPARSTRTNPNQVVVTFGSYINRNSNESNGCTPAGLRRRRDSTCTPASRRPARATTRS